MLTEKEANHLLNEIASVTAWIKKNLSRYPEDAEEISNDVFRELHKQITSGKAIDFPVRYAFTIARKRIAKFHQKRSYVGQKTKLYSCSFGEDDYSEDLSIKIEQREAIALIDALPEPSKTIILKRVEAGLTFKEIDKMFNRSESWACEEFQKATKLLNKNIGS